MRAGVFFLGAVSICAFAADPRLEKDDVRSCVEHVKRFLRSADYSGAENEQKVIGACRDADPDCVGEVGDSLHSSDPVTAEQFLSLVRACRGHGMGKCFRALKESTPSFNRREIPQIQALLKKCE